MSDDLHEKALEAALHDSDCARYNAPAYQKGRCDCSTRTRIEAYLAAINFDATEALINAALAVDDEVQRTQHVSLMARILDLSQHPLRTRAFVWLHDARMAWDAARDRLRRAAEGGV